MNPNKSSLIVMAVLVLLVAVVPAGAQNIRYNALPGTDFTKYKTYKWVRVPKAEYPNQILDTQIMQAIDAQLALKGLTKTEERNCRPLCLLPGRGKPATAVEFLQYRRHGWLGLWPLGRLGRLWRWHGNNDRYQLNHQYRDYRCGPV